MRYIGVDWGRKRVGLAITDPEGKIAMPLKVIEKESLFEEIENLRREYGEVEVVLGLPVRTDGIRGGSEAEVLKIKEALESMGIRVTLWKEWFSSVETERILKTGESDWRKRKKVRDKVSAALILEAFLRSVKRYDG